MAKIQLVIVTPEATTFDESVESVTLPLVDGEAGVLPRHAPMIGRLGPGELRAKSGNTESRFYVDGGFAQIEDDVVTVLTGCASVASEIDLAAAKTEMDEALALPSGNTMLAELKRKSVAQARAKIRVGEQS